MTLRDHRDESLLDEEDIGYTLAGLIQRLSLDKSHARQVWTNPLDLLRWQRGQNTVTECPGTCQ
ncbi:MAG: hypothetical protein ACJ8AI_32110 [Rhodopila sp.]